MAIFDLFNYGFSAAIVGTIVMGLLVYVATSYATYLFLQACGDSMPYLAFVPCNGFRYMLIANNLEIINPTGVNPVLLKIGGFVSFRIISWNYTLTRIYIWDSWWYMHNLHVRCKFLFITEAV